jgi:hypothetical protein
MSLAPCDLLYPPHDGFQPFGKVLKVLCRSYHAATYVMRESCRRHRGTVGGQYHTPLVQGTTGRANARGLDDRRLESVVTAVSGAKSMWVAHSSFSRDDDDEDSFRGFPQTLRAALPASHRQYMSIDLPLPLLHELLGLHQDRAGVQALVRDLLAETTTPFLVRAPEAIS